MKPHVCPKCNGVNIAACEPCHGTGIVWEFVLADIVPKPAEPPAYPTPRSPWPGYPQVPPAMPWDPVMPFGPFIWGACSIVCRGEYQTWYNSLPRSAETACVTLPFGERAWVGETKPFIGALTPQSVS